MSKWLEAKEEGMSRMFKTIDRTWNPFTGCLYFCYNGGCWARRTAVRLEHLERYKDGFVPRFHEKEMLKTFSPGQFVAVSLMGDIAFATREEFLRILARIREFPQTYFLIQSKNPKQLYDWREDWGITLPPNVYPGTTIETNRDYGLTKAPAPVERFRYLAGYPHNFKFISIEPIMDFDLAHLVAWMKIIKPEIIEIGADNYHNHLPEPPGLKIRWLLESLKGICPTVIEKPGLERLKGDR